MFKDQIKLVSNKVEDCLYTENQPHVDLIIRTSGENILLVILCCGKLPIQNNRLHIYIVEDFLHQNQTIF